MEVLTSRKGTAWGAMAKLTVRRVGNSLGVLLPRATIRAMKIRVGDSLFLVETRAGLRIAAFDPDFERQMKVAEKVRKRHRKALRRLSTR